MHKRFVNHCTIALSLSPNGPILIKSGKEGADPTKPDMEFVETYHAGGRSIYLPGSSLKGAIRAHAERIVRTVGQANKPSNPESSVLWASDPLNLSDFDYLKDDEPAKRYKKSSFTDRLFGHPYLASRCRIEDAYPAEGTTVKTEERNGVAIDRVFGSVAVGPFNYQVCTSGTFQTKIHLKNFTLAQLGLIGLVLRDLNDGWFGIGFAKSRGLGNVTVNFAKAVVQYPGCILEGDRMKLLGSTDKSWEKTKLLGAGEFLSSEEAERYGFPHPDREETPVAAEEETPVAAEAMPLGFGAQLTWEGDRVPDLFERAVRAWKHTVTAGSRS